MKFNFIDSTSVGDIPRIVAVIAGNVDNFSNLAQKAKEEGADILEFRADFCTDQNADEILSILRSLKAETGLPILLTIRQFSEGGYFKGSGNFIGSEAERRSLYECLLPEVDAIDVEVYAKEILDELVATAHELGKFVVLSYHNFKHTPNATKLNEIVDDAISFNADMVKIAVASSSEEDVNSLSRFTASFNKNILLTTISMGEIGVVSRILNPFLGSCFTYGFIGEEPTTPGQIRVSQLRQLIDAFRGQRIFDLNEAEKLLHSAFHLDSHKVIYPQAVSPEAVFI
jgi:3-dehydroquinate dehydratase-1